MGWSEFWKIIALSIGSVATLFILVKLIGNKQLSQLSMFDYVNGITIGSIAAEMSTSLENSFFQPLTAMVVYGLAAVAISYFSQKSIKVRRFISGTATILVENGKIYEENLKKARLDVNEFLMQCRNSGYFNVADLQSAILEPNGRISFLPKSDIRPLTPGDLSLSPPQEKVVANVIMDGKVMEGNLRHTGNDIQWLKKQLKSQGIGSVKEVFLATCDDQNELSVYVKVGKPNNTNVLE